MSWTRNKCQSSFKPVGAFIPKELLAKPEASKVICRVNGSLGGMELDLDASRKAFREAFRKEKP